MHKKDFKSFLCMSRHETRNSSPGIFMRKAIVRTKKDHRVPSNLTSFSLMSQCLFCFAKTSLNLVVLVHNSSPMKNK